MILHKELRTVLAFPKENFSTARMHFCILRDIIDASLVYCPTISFCIVLLDFFQRVSDFVRILYEVLTSSVLLNEHLKTNKRAKLRIEKKYQFITYALRVTITHWHLCSRYVCYYSWLGPASDT